MPFLYFEEYCIIGGKKTFERVIIITGIIATIMVFSIPLVAILTSHFRKQLKIKQEMLKDEVELEKLKQQNFLLETERMKLELEKLQLNQPMDDIYKIK